METILNFLPLTDTERAQFLAAAPDDEQLFLSWSQVSDLPADLRARTTIVLGALSPRILSGAESLKWLQTQTAGTNRYEEPGVFPEGAMLTSAVGAFGGAVSEHMLATTLALMKHLPIYRDRQSARVWAGEDRARTLKNAKVFLLGTGDIGGHLAALVKAAGARTVGFNRHPDRPVAHMDELHAISELDQWLPQADVVAMSLPHTPETVHIMDAHRLSLMKPGAILVNAGRGDAVDCMALAEILKAGKLLGAALDVTEPEPLPADHPLWDCPNLLLTPHSGAGHLEETEHEIAAIALENLRRFKAGEPLRNRVR